MAKPASKEDDDNQTAPKCCESDDESNMTPSDGVIDRSSSSNKNGKVSLVATLVGILVAVVIGLLAGKHYGSQLVSSSSEGLLASPEVVAPQCEDERMESLSSNSSKVKTIKKNQSKLVFQYATIEDETVNENDQTVVQASEDDKSEGVENLRQLMINAYGLEDHFEEYDGTNGKQVITDVLEDMLESSDECEDMFQLYGHFANDATLGSSSTLQAIGMFRDGGGHVSLTAWPSEGKLMANFLIAPPRSSEKDDEDEDDEEMQSETALFACISSIAKFLYPDDVLEPNGVKGDIGNVPHLSQMGPFDVISKHGKDPFRFRWWVTKERGFTVDLNEADLLEQMGCSDDWTNRVVSVQSPFQRIDIIDSEDDYITTHLLQYYEDPQESEKRKYMDAHPQFFRPDRMLYLDGVIQSTLQGLAAYHEALVHPAMFTHPNPKRVAIVGGGECATLRETLKHNTVETVVMVEIDPVIVEVSKHYLPEWNDCSMYEGSSRYCMDDPRVEMYHLDALKWFRDRFSDEAKLEGHELYGTEEKFDVVILDALDPQNAVDFVEALYGDGAFLNSLYNSLTEDGVLLTQVGEAVYVGDISETYPGNFNYQRSMYEKGLKNQGFAVVMNYEEHRAGFGGTWSFFAAFKNDSSRARWQMNEAQLDLEIQKRTIRRVEEDTIEMGELKGPFDYFDGTTMVTYRNPSRGAQVVYCLRDPSPYGCTTDVLDHYADKKLYYESTGFDPEIPNLTAENFVLTNNSGLVGRVVVPENTYLMLEQSIQNIRITPSTSAILRSEEAVYERTIGPVTEFVSGNRKGSTIPRRGDIHSAYMVDSGLLSFIQHGCGGSFNTASLHFSSSSLTEDTADPNIVPEDGLLGRSYSNIVMEELIFNPSHTRNSHRTEYLVSSRTIPEGEGITSNYVPWYNDDGWKDHIETLRSRCSNSDQQ